MVLMRVAEDHMIKSGQCGGHLPDKGQHPIVRADRQIVVTSCVVHEREVCPSHKDGQARSHIHHVDREG
jgi:hypothetical protein